MANSEILVTGASGGRQGATGNHVTRMLLERGVPVRALVHRDDERSNNIRALGAEIIEGDLLDLQSIRNAMAGFGGPTSLIRCRMGCWTLRRFSPLMREAGAGACRQSIATLDPPGEPPDAESETSLALGPDL